MFSSYHTLTGIKNQHKEGKKTALSDTVFFPVIILHYKFKLKGIFDIKRYSRGVVQSPEIPQTFN